MIEEIIIVNNEPFYRIPNGTSYEYAPIPKEFKPYFERLQQENKQLKEVINKAIEYINNNYPLRTSFSKNIYDFKIEIKKILTGDSNE